MNKEHRIVYVPCAIDGTPGFQITSNGNWYANILPEFSMNQYFYFLFTGALANSTVGNMLITVEFEYIPSPLLIDFIKPSLPIDANASFSFINTLFRDYPHLY
jgi:hypothetical protein